MYTWEVTVTVVLVKIFLKSPLSLLNTTERNCTIFARKIVWFRLYLVAPFSEYCSEVMGTEFRRRPK